MAIGSGSKSVGHTSTPSNTTRAFASTLRERPTAARRCGPRRKLCISTHPPGTTHGQNLEGEIHSN
eukprot:3150278-Lingulodinium_polyedra.AAC.1